MARLPACFQLQVIQSYIETTRLIADNSTVDNSPSTNVLF